MTWFIVGPLALVATASVGVAGIRPYHRAKHRACLKRTVRLEVALGMREALPPVEKWGKIIVQPHPSWNSSADASDVAKQMQASNKRLAKLLDNKMRGGGTP